MRQYYPAEFQYVQNQGFAWSSNAMDEEQEAVHNNQFITWSHCLSNEVTPFG